MKEIVPYLHFGGNCRQAMEFYQRCFAGELFLLPYSEVPEEILGEAKKDTDRIMHATLSKGTTLLMASDTTPGMPFQQGNNVSVIVQCESLQEIETLFTAIGEEGTITMSLQDTFWGARFGTLTDRFGVRWMFNFGYAQ